MFVLIESFYLKSSFYLFTFLPLNYPNTKMMIWMVTILRNIAKGYTLA